MSVSLSKSALLLSPCIRWAWEGAKPYEPEHTDTTKRDKGILFHEGIDSRFRAGAIYTRNYDPQVGKWWDMACDWWDKHMAPRVAVVSSEEYIAVNFATGETHVDSKVKNRQYPDLPGMTPGTADLVCILKDGTLWVADWKTGSGNGAREQLMSLAYGFYRHDQNRAKSFGSTAKTMRAFKLCIIYVTDDGIRPVELDVTPAELEAHAAAMAFAAEDIGTRTEPVPGIHCSQLYCPHLAYCPGISSVLEKASEGQQGLLPPERLVRSYRLQDPLSSDEHAGYVMERVTAAKRQLDFHQTRIRSYCESGGRVIAGDYEYSKGRDGFRWRPKK